MKFSSTFARLLWRGGFAAGVTALALVACGGGTSVEAFQPNRIVAFGDEASVLDVSTAARGHFPQSAASTAAIKYGVNAFDTAASVPANTLIRCDVNALWIQSVASVFGLAFKECPAAVASPTGVVYAQPEARVADIKAQVDAFLAGPDKPFTDKDIVTLMAGQNDVIAEFLRAGASDDERIETMRQRGKALAEQANRVAVAGPAVIVSRIPNVGYTPWARSKTAAEIDLLRRMTEAFNTALQLNLINDGHLIGLVFGDTEVRNMVEFSGAFGISNVKDPVCQAAASSTTKLDDVALFKDQPCTTNRLVAAATPPSPASAASTPYLQYLWAGNTTLGPVAQSRIGGLAANRARSNPF